ncbi:hypothetical protein [Pararhodobacter zhoushanensis]|uniref:Uncharacterized protein n=1 Tax=Pararhodobacter zhoushanensis TaxID=2479545 RepID=A0ABT3H566_9RHOB|nr:hypothetical protein [Pararhodobacter zhoushanensis]MCW1934949.1 hypothetical protein [Pararhodobacter zhoushanensis]
MLLISTGSAASEIRHISSPIRARLVSQNRAEEHAADICSGRIGLVERLQAGNESPNTPQVCIAWPTPSRSHLTNGLRRKARSGTAACRD